MASSNPALPQLAYADPEDQEAFGSCILVHSVVHDLLLDVKNNTPGIKELDFQTYYHWGAHFRILELSAAAWRRIGQFIGKNEHVEELNLQECPLTVQKLQSFFDGLAGNTSVKRLLLGDNVFLGPTDVLPCLYPYLKSNAQLLELRLSNLGLSIDHLSDLATSLEGTQVKTIDISNNYLGDDDRVWDILSTILRQQRLEGLKLSQIGVGRKGCLTMAHILQEDDCELQTLCLDDNNEINDECCSILTSSLQKNSVLETLNMEGNDKVTEAGLDHFLNLLCNPSSIRSTYESNHTLSGLGPQGEYLVEIGGMNEWDSPVCERLLRMQEINFQSRSKEEAGRRKVVSAHFDGDFDLTPFADFDVTVVPSLIHWFGANPMCLQHIYHFVRHWDVATLVTVPHKPSVE